MPSDDGEDGGDVDARASRTRAMAMVMGSMTTTTTMTTMTTGSVSMTTRAVVRGERAMGRVRGGMRTPRARTTTRASMGPELKANIDAFISENKVVLFMKGTKEAPRCGFSNTCVQILQSMNVPFADVDILSNEDLRQGMKDYSNWPTFPQLYIGGEFFGGCDITVDAFKDGSLKEELERAMLE
jgi:monothiol glutaredoxin